MWAPAAQFGRDPRPGTKLTQPGPPAPPTPRKETPTQDGVCSVIFTCTHAGAQGTAKELASEELDHAGRQPNARRHSRAPHAADLICTSALASHADVLRTLNAISISMQQAGDLFLRRKHTL
ncbi:unnamed protein product [Arctogadus glacialis]